jgi:ribonuclease BN (tRNA processing enzyme)
VLLIDAGTGVRRLLDDPGLLDDVQSLNIVLTHFHLDHVTGLSYLPALPLKPTLWGPGSRLTGHSTASILGRMFGSPLFGATIEDLTAAVREIPDTDFAAGPFSIASRVQTMHTDPTLGLRIGPITYCTDTAADPETAEFAAGSRVLLHEAWHATAHTGDETHSAAGEAGALARKAEVEELVLIHVSPMQTDDAALAAPAQAEFPEVRVGEDLLVVTE